MAKITNIPARIKREYKDLHYKYSPKNNVRRNIKKFYQQVQHNQYRRPKEFENKIEIVIPCYNHCDYLEQTFASIKTQTWHKYPITVTFLNDNSTDDTQAVLNKLVKKPNKNIRIRLIHNKTNLRQWASINKAVGSSKNQLFVVLNDDDLLVPDALEKIVKAYKKYPNIMMLGAHSLWFREGKPLPKHKVQAFNDLDITIHQPEQAREFRDLSGINMTHSGSSFFKSAWKAADGYHPISKRLHSQAPEDRDFQIRVNVVAPIGVYYNYPLSYWRTDTSHGKVH